mmetsp:Transcript_12232/g.52579  ORF Transcript_12232/g.52579 Transcript_12232/m.52579 type:complete len:200 (-) Transcript_12232:1283-1882(-)
MRPTRGSPRVMTRPSSACRRWRAHPSRKRHTRRGGSEPHGWRSGGSRFLRRATPPAARRSRPRSIPSSPPRLCTKAELRPTRTHHTRPAAVEASTRRPGIPLSCHYRGCRRGCTRCRFPRGTGRWPRPCRRLPWRSRRAGSRSPRAPAVCQRPGRRRRGATASRRASCRRGYGKKFRPPGSLPRPCPSRRGGAIRCSRR